MDRIYLIVDTRTSPGPLPAEVEAHPDRVWIERSAGLTPARRDLLFREADLFLAGAGQQEVPGRYLGTPGWIESSSEPGEFTVHDAHGFDGTLLSCKDEDFDELNAALGDPEPTLPAFGEAARKHTGAKKIHRFLAQAALVSSLLPMVTVALGFLFRLEGKGLTFVEQALLILSFGVAILLWRSSSKKRWTRARSAREMWRSLRHSLPFLDPVRPVQAVPFPRYRGIIQTLLAREMGLTIADRRAREKGAVVEFPQVGDDTFEKARREYLENRIGGEDGQIRHFQEKRDEAARNHCILRWIFLASSFLSAVCAVVMISWAGGAIDDGGSGIIKRVFYDFGEFFFPALAAGAIGIVGLSGIARQAGLYSIMASRLHHAYQDMYLCEEEDAFRELVNETEAVLLWEVAGWASLNEF